MWADVAHEDDYVSDATDMRQIPGLGRTLVATRPIAAGTVLLSEFPLLMSVRELPRDTLQAVLDADTSAPHADTVKNAHAFLRAPEATQELFLRECCGEEGFEDSEHSFIIEMREGANWCVRHDPACAGVAERCACRSPHHLDRIPPSPGARLGGARGAAGVGAWPLLQHPSSRRSPSDRATVVAPTSTWTVVIATRWTRRLTPTQPATLASGPPSLPVMQADVRLRWTIPRRAPVRRRMSAAAGWPAAR